MDAGFARRRAPDASARSAEGPSNNSTIATNRPLRKWLQARRGRPEGRPLTVSTVLRDRLAAVLLAGGVVWVGGVAVARREIAAAHLRF